MESAGHDPAILSLLRTVAQHRKQLAHRFDDLVPDLISHSGLRSDDCGQPRLSAYTRA